MIQPGSKTRLFIILLTLLIARTGFAQPAQPARPAPLAQSEPRLNNVTNSWVGNTWGGWTGNFRLPTGHKWAGLRGSKFQPGLQAIGVTSDGTVMTLGRGDGKRYAILRDGFQIEQVDDAGYHIYFSSAVAGDDKYFYWAQRHPGRGNGTEKTSDGQPKFAPQGELWAAIMRVDRQGKIAPFPGGFGDFANGLVIDKRGPHLRGLTTDAKGRVYVSDPSTGEITALDRETMKPVQADGKPLSIPLDRADRLAYDVSRDQVWAVSARKMVTEPRIVRIRAGGPRIGEWGTDVWRWKGVLAPVEGEVDLSAVTENPAPTQTYATAFLTPRTIYRLHGFAHNSPAKVRLHMLEPLAKANGERVFDVRINNVTVLNKFDLLKEIGSRNKVIVKEFETMVTGEGEIAIDFDAGKGGKQASYSAIEVIGVRSTGEIATAASITPFTRDLTPAGAPIVLNDSVDPVGLAVAPDGLLYVADNGRDLQVKIYDPKNPTAPVRTMGVTGGAFAGPVPGTLSQDRFAFLTDVGIDGAGNVYIAQDGNPVQSDISGASLSCFAPDGSLKWMLEGLTFMDEPDWDRGPDGTQEDVLYGPQRKFKVDPDAPAGHNWSAVAFTHDRVKYPNDLRSFDRGLDRDNVWIRYVNGQKFMVVAGGGSEGKPLVVYRFEQGSEIAIPCAAYGRNQQSSAEKFPGLPDSGEWFWTDQNRDGNYQPEEFATRDIKYGPNDRFDGPPFFGLTLDRDGGLWLSNNDRFVRYFKPTVTEGVLGYSFQDSALWTIPTEFAGRVGRIQYDKANDAMYLSGVLPPSQPALLTVSGLEKPDTRHVGNCIARFDGWMKGIENGTLDPTKPITAPKATWVTEIPFNSTRDVDRHGAVDLPVMMTAEGDYVFVGYSRLGRVRVYNAVDGSFAGFWEMGPSLRIEDQSKGNALSNSHLNYGLMDSPIGLRVMKRRDGSYVLTYHDNFLSHTRLYVWRPDQSPPPAVWDLMATAANGGVDLKWSDAPGATDYRVERLIASGAAKWDVIAESVSGTTLTDTSGLMPDVTTHYRLRAKNAAGEWSDYSNVKFVVPAK